MASTGALLTEKAIALQEAVQTVESLLEEDSVRLTSAQQDVVGRGMDDFVSAMLIAELTRVVAAQQERIGELEKSTKAKAKK